MDVGGARRSLHPRSRHARSADATASNPFGKIPSLVDGDFTMFESAAINTYLGDKFRGREGCADLVPAAGTIERGRYEQQVIVMAELDSQGLWIHRKHEALGQIFGEIPPAVAHAKQHVSKVIEVLETDLRSDGPYLCGSAFSAAVSSSQLHYQQQLTATSHTEASAPSCHQLRR